MSEFQFFEAAGFVWPVTRATDAERAKYPEKYIHRARDMQIAIDLIPAADRKVVVQAGGHCGMWPLYLSDRFDAVYTFEPEARNFACLARNAARSNIYACRGVLSDVARPIVLKESGKHIGSHHGRPNEQGPTPAYRIDDMHLPRLDLLVLDVEGMESLVLQGASTTLEKYRPVLMLEDRGLGERFGIGDYNMMVTWLQGMYGYEEVARVARDVIFKARYRFHGIPT